MDKIITETLNDRKIERNTRELARLLSSLRSPFNKIRKLLFEFYGIPGIDLLKVSAKKERYIAENIEFLRDSIQKHLDEIHSIIHQILYIISKLEKDGVYFKNIENLEALVNLDIANVNGFTASMIELKIFVTNTELQEIATVLPPPDWNDLKKAYKEVTEKLEDYLALLEKHNLNLNLDKIKPYFKG